MTNNRSADLRVMKFGGTSVQTPERMRNVAERVARVHTKGEQIVVVVSAMGHSTDELIELAHKVSENPPGREMDMLLTAGERISMSLLSMALADLGVRARSFTGSQSGIITTSVHGRAKIQRILGDRIRVALSAGEVAIVAGFQGVSKEKEITTLGRGGSDTTAVALAAVLGAQICEIYTDVDGVFNADPRVVLGAKLLPRVMHDQMVELSTRGAGVLHPRSVELAKQFGVKLWVKNSLGGESLENLGTEIVSSVADSKAGIQARPTGDLNQMEAFQVTGVTADRGRVLVTAHLARPTCVTAVWAAARSAQLSIVAPIFDQEKAQFFAEKNAMNEWKRSLDKLVLDGFLKSYQWLGPDPSNRSGQEWSPVSVVGDRFSQDGAVFEKICEALAEEHIPFQMGSGSALAVTVAVPVTHLDDAVKKLAQIFCSA